MGAGAGAGAGAGCGVMSCWKRTKVAHYVCLLHNVPLLIICLSAI